jgi:hypothetical protein
MLIELCSKIAKKKKKTQKSSNANLDGETILEFDAQNDAHSTPK